MKLYIPFQLLVVGPFKGAEEPFLPAFGALRNGYPLLHYNMLLRFPTDPRRDQRLAEEAARQEARRKAGDATAGPQVLQPYGRAVELMQLHVASALDQLSASLRAAGVGSLSPVPLPGAEEPDLVAAYAALLLGRDVWGVMGPARMQALLTFGGTLAALSPTASRVVEEWLRRLGDAEGAILPGLMLAEESSGKEWAVGKGRRAAALSEEGMKVLQHLLVHVEEQFTEQGVQGEGGGSHPVAWIALMSLPQGELRVVGTRGGCMVGRRRRARIASEGQVGSYRQCRNSSWVAAAQCSTFQGCGTTSGGILSQPL